jgi:hypothetical protein
MQWPAWLDSVGAGISKFFAWVGYEDAVQSLVIYGVGIALYTLLVFAFYENLSKRDAFDIKRQKGFWGRSVHGFQAGFVFPLMSFLYFAVLAGSLIVLAKSQSTFQILLLAMAVVIGVRVTAFVSENASLDLAKMLPLALLGVLIVDPTYTSFDGAWARVKELPGLTPVLLRCFLLFIVLEGILRVGRVAVMRVHAKVPKRAKAKRLHVDRATLASESAIKSSTTKLGSAEFVDLSAQR